ncbi:MAG: hypothetical protein JW931_02345 [Methanomicrobiaceae archaeon]|nr:hypothetical protein [Methanomicrobiaceae archaeon]
MGIIEDGFEEILKKIEESKEREEELTAEVIEKEALLLERLAEKAKPFVSEVGVTLLVGAKSDATGQMVETHFHKKKMFVLGKTDPMPYRPDDMSKPVNSQFCALTEDGTFLEIMYSTIGPITDSYENELTAAEALDLYGLEILYMLYKAFEQYLNEEKEFVDALEKVVSFMMDKKYKN